MFRSAGSALLPREIQSLRPIKSRRQDTAICEKMDIQPRWYAVCTRSRHEKTVSEFVQQRGIEAFLPLYEVVRRWRNGDHRIHLPLFPGYAFVRILNRDRLQILRVPGVVRLVGFNGTPAALPDEDIENMRRAIAHGLKGLPHRYVRAGQRVRVTAGPFAGLEGILVRQKGAMRMVVSIELIQRSIQVEVATEYLQPLQNPRLCSGRADTH